MSAFQHYQHLKITHDEMIQASRSFYHLMDQRRTIREFSHQEVPFEVMQHIIQTASTAPSGAHKQPWTFCLVGDVKIKKQIREAAEEEERINYLSRMSEQWKQDLEPLGTEPYKPYLTIAPWLVVIFKRPFDWTEDGHKKPNYYVNESVGLACGFLLVAIHNAGLAAVTHTPSPMNFLQDILNRAGNEKPFLLIPVGYPADDAHVPVLKRKPFEDVSDVY